MDGRAGEPADGRVRWRDIYIYRMAGMKARVRRRVRQIFGSNLEARTRPEENQLKLAIQRPSKADDRRVY